MKNTLFTPPYWLLLLSGLTLTACQDEISQPASPSFPDRLAFVNDRLYPEGITYSPQLGQFLVSSLTQGKVGAIDKNGYYTDFVSDPQLIGSVGMKVRNGKLYVCNGDQGVSVKSTAQTPFMTAGLFVFDIATKQVERRIDLAALLPGQRHFANDIAFDAAGNTYVTDSFSPVIYKVTPDGTASVFITNPLFSSSTFGLNGIVFHPSGYLIVAQTGAAKLYRIDLQNTNTISEITGTGPIAGDGMVLLGNDLYAVTNGGSQVSQLRSSDNFQTASVVKVDTVGYSQATTNTEVNGQIYTINARIGEISAARGNGALLQSRDYTIQRFK